MNELSRTHSRFSSIVVAEAMGVCETMRPRVVAPRADRPGGGGRRGQDDCLPGRPDVATGGLDAVAQNLAHVVADGEVRIVWISGVPHPPGLVDAARGVYGTVYVGRMRRTNIYLTDTEHAALDARAIAEGSTRSEILRVIVDRQLNLGEDADVDAALGLVAAELAERARAISSDDIDLHIA